MPKKCYILTSRKKGTKQKFSNSGPYKFPKKSMFGSFSLLKKVNPTLDLKFKKVKC